MSGGSHLALNGSARRACAWRAGGHWTAATAGVFCLLFSAAWGAEIPAPRPHPERDFDTYRPTGKATRIQANEAPIIDGDLSDPAWAKAEPIDEFYQLDPDTGKPGSGPTVARFLYDEAN